MKHSIFLLVLLTATSAVAAENPLDYTMQTDLTAGGKFPKLECYSQFETVCDKKFRCTALDDSPTPPDAQGKPQPLVRFTVDLKKRTLQWFGKSTQNLPGLAAEKRNDDLDFHWNATMGDVKLTLIAQFLANPKNTKFYYNRTSPAPLSPMTHVNLEFGRCNLASDVKQD